MTKFRRAWLSLAPRHRPWQSIFLKAPIDNCTYLWNVFRGILLLPKPPHRIHPLLTLRAQIHRRRPDRHMPQIVLHYLQRHCLMPFPALQRMRGMRMSQPVRAGFQQLFCICLSQTFARRCQESLDRPVEPGGRPRGRWLTTITLAGVLPHVGMLPVDRLSFRAFFLSSI